MTDTYGKIKSAVYKKSIILIIIIISLIIRFVFTKTTAIPILVADSPTYLEGAKYLYEYLCIDLYRPPVYPLGIIVVSLVFGWGPQSPGIIFLHILFSLVCILLAYDICLKLTGSSVYANWTCLMTGASISIFGWDFIIMAENFSIFFLTLSVWLLLRFFSTKAFIYLKLLNMVLFLLFFTKPFFLAYPVLILIVFLLRHFIVGDINMTKALASLASGLILIYLCAFGYSVLNYYQNNYFGFSAVGNVNSFGKILQYHMEDLGDNDKLVKDVKDAYANAAEKDLVDGDYLEPWYFIDKYGYKEQNYKEIGDFASEIIKQHPIKYSFESLKLMGKIFMTLPPYRDYIAVSAITEPGTAARFMEGLAGLYQKLDLLYYFMLLGILEVLYSLFLKPEAFKGNVFIIMILSLVVLYHYAVGIFFSYGDYCRLFAPSYIIMYILSNYYIFRTFSTAAKFVKQLIFEKKIAAE